MRSSCLSTLSLAVLSTALGLGCAAPVEEEAGGGSDAMSLDTTLSADELAAIRSGEGLSCGGETVGDAVVCSHPLGVVVMSPDGLALLRAEGDVVTAKALAKEAAEKDDVGTVLDAVDGGSSGTATASLRIQSKWTVLVSVLERAAEALAKARHLTVPAAERQAQVAATRSATLAGDLSLFSRSSVLNESARPLALKFAVRA